MWIKKENRLGALQGTAQNKTSNLHTSLLLRETVQYHAEKNGSVYVTFLDAQKAFDYIWTDGIFMKIFKLGVNPKLWWLLCKQYPDLQCRVRLGEHLSRDFKVLYVFQAGGGLHTSSNIILRSDQNVV